MKFYLRNNMKETKKYKPVFKIYSKALIFLVMLIMCLFFVNLIPNSLIYDNLQESIIYYNKIDYQSMVGDTNFSKNDASADSTALNLMMNSDNKQPLYSTLIAPAYRDFNSQDFIKMGYDTIINDKDANYDYNRYWHGYQIVWRPLLMITNIRGIMLVMLIAYIILLGFTIYKSYATNNKLFGISLVLMNIGYIIPFGFTALEYIPVFFIYLISCLLLLYKKDYRLVFSCSGIAVAFFDFLTAETLTLTIPLLLYAVLNKKNLKIKDTIIACVSWLISYCSTFIAKWGISSLIYQKNYFSIALDKYNTHEMLFGRLFSVKYNINTLLGNTMTFNNSFWLFISITLVLIIIVYLFRKNSTSSKYLLCMLAICMIPYIRYFILAGHSWAYQWFTYRAQLVLIPVLVLTLSELDFSLVGRRKK